MVVPKQKYEIKVSRPQVCKPASLARLDLVCILSSPFVRRSIVDPDDLRRSVHGGRAARGQVFGVACDRIDLVNG